VAAVVVHARSVDDQHERPRSAGEQAAVGGVRLSGQLRCATPEQVDAVLGKLPEHVALTRAEPGCLRFDVVPLGDGLTWQVEEVFTSAAAFRAHRERVAASAWGAATAGVERRYRVEGLVG